MKTTTIPAQITTVEDTIAGNLTLSQILLLIAPVFGSTAVYAVLPPSMSIVMYKLGLMVLLSLMFVVLAIRIRDKLVTSWLKIMILYALRPHIYIFNKNTDCQREAFIAKKQNKAQVNSKEKVKLKSQEIAANDFDYESLARDPKVNVRFTKNGLLVIKNI